jgi:uncharacterized protein YggE
MKRPVLGRTPVIAAFLWALACVPAMADVNTPEIVVTATGSAGVMPDRVQIDINIDTTGDTPDDASEKNIRDFELLVARLADVGFSREQLITTRYGVETIYDQKKREKIRGYQVRHASRLVTADLERIGEIVDAVLGAESARVGRVSWVTTKVDSIRRVAIAHAVRNVKQDAVIMAEAAGGGLGRLIELTTHFADNPTFRRDYTMQALAISVGTRPPTTLTPTEVTVKVSVLGRWVFRGDQTD